MADVILGETRGGLWAGFARWRTYTGNRSHPEDFLIDGIPDDALSDVAMGHKVLRTTDLNYVLHEALAAAMARQAIEGVAVDSEAIAAVVAAKLPGQSAEVIKGALREVFADAGTA